MNEIEKLYENARVKPIDIAEYGSTYIPGRIEINGKPYPPFTAEKQLELIKFLFNHSVYYDVDVKGNYWFHITDDCYTYYYNKFEIALANIINEMWQNLTSEEKEQIRGILE